MLKTKKYILFGITILLSLLIIFISLCFGRYNINFNKFLQIIFGKLNTENTIEYNVILNLRLPRTLLAFMVGGALTLSGLIYQETFQNNLVSPSILGVSSGSSVGAGFAIVLGLSNVMWGMGVSFFAFIFGILTILITIFVSKMFKNTKTLSLILAGIIITGFMSSVISVIKTVANEQTQLPSIIFWLMGSFSEVKMYQVWIFMPIYIVSIIILFSIRWRINIISRGEEIAQSRGLNYKYYRWIIIIISTLLTASSIAVAGNITWIGLVIPNIIRIWLGKNTKTTIPFSITIGGSFMVIIDIISRTLTSGEIPISAISGIIGAILFAYILIVKKGKNEKS
ncbi:iron ABC transporter permease [Mycoplasma sp. CSL10137]|uniref:FecCD family ABC transporter permease n=1 Tax=unclassified Mycoplasma TaxID=2683645 RepID=UPI00197B0840|nr:MULTISPECIES: iron ABC transporter permease [unclassified Mycoplasma]MBN4083825.1 iron ABC transporter permease [Mycoplasma sp. CSL10137]MBN4084216.1 iron ABC transporter permease [Mycoplasma sp. CSL10166]